LREHWHNIPFAPRRWPFFYGWVIVAVATLGMLSSIPGQIMGIGVFADSLVDALKIDRTLLSTAYMLGTITSSLLLPFAGSMVDRFGIRAMIVVSSLGMALSLVISSQSDHLAFITGAHTVVLSFLIAYIGYFLIRFFGQGCLMIVSRVAIGKWFNHRRGLASAITGIFVAFSFNASPRLLDMVVQFLGWRHTYWALAVIIGGGMSLIGWIFFREEPEDCGLVMDGIDDPVWYDKMAAKVADVHKEFTRSEAMRTVAFWVFSLSIGNQALIVTALNFNVALLGSETGLTRVESYGVFLPMAVLGVFANIFAGWISDRIHLKWVLIVQLSGQALGLLGLLNFGHQFGQLMIICGYGLSFGIFLVLVTVTWPRFFGREHLGAISGMGISIMVFASALGPVLFNFVHYLTGSYREVIIGCMFIPAVLTIAVLKSDNPQEMARYVANK